MNKRKIAEIVKFNVEKSIQNKSFVILNIIMCLVMIISANIGNIKGFLKANNLDIFEEEFKIQIIDEIGLATNLIQEEFGDNELITIENISENNYTKENIEDDLIIAEYRVDEENNLKTVITSKESIDSSIYNKFVNVSKKIRNQIMASNLGVDVSKIESLSEDPEIERVMLSVDAENSDTKQTVKTASVLIVYIVLIFILSRIANEIATEKLSKSIEYVLTSVEASEYLLAKVLSITITIFIQLIYSFVYFMLGNCINALVNISNVESVQSSLQSIDMSVVSYVLVMAGYLIFTVFFMAMIQAAISSKTTSIAEAGNTTMLLLMVVVVLYFVSLSVISPYNKVSTAMYIISCIPMVSTFFVPSMMIIGQATTLQIVISFVVLVLSTPLLFKKCSQKFKDGILDYTIKKNKKIKTKKERTLKEEQEFLMKSNGIKRFAFTIGLALLIWFVCEQILGLVLPGLLQSLLGNILSDKSVTWIGFALISILSFSAAIWIINSYTEDEYKKIEKVDLKTGLKTVLMGFGFIILLQYLQSFIIEKIGSNYNILSDKMVVLKSDGILDKILYIIGIAVVPGIFEELFVRKAILGYGRKYGKYFALILSALIFALIHMNLAQGIFAFFMGLLFGIIFLKTGDIRLTIALHIINNGLVSISGLVAENAILSNIIEIGTIVIAVIGILLFIVNVIKNKGLNFEKEKFKEEYKMLLRNYTFDLVIVLFIVLTILSENYLRIL